MNRAEDSVFKKNFLVTSEFCTLCALHAVASFLTLFRSILHVSTFYHSFFVLCCQREMSLVFYSALCPLCFNNFQFALSVQLLHRLSCWCSTFFSYYVFYDLLLALCSGWRITYAAVRAPIKFLTREVIG